MLFRFARASYRLAKQPNVEEGLNHASQRNQFDSNKELLTKFMGNNWKKHINQQLEYFNATVKELKDNRVHVSAVLLPRGSWDKALPFHEHYSKAVRTVCQKYNMEIIDFSNLLPDNHFAYANHVNPFGQEVLFPRLISISRLHYHPLDD